MAFLQSLYISLTSLISYRFAIFSSTVRFCIVLLATDDAYRSCMLSANPLSVLALIKPLRQLFRTSFMSLGSSTLLYFSTVVPTTLAFMNSAYDSKPSLACYLMFILVFRNFIVSITF